MIRWATDGGQEFQFDDEFHRDAIFTGDAQLAMANSGRDTNGSQFFVTIGSERHLDFNHTIFGQLVRGREVLTRINAVATDLNGRPLTDVVITDAAIVPNTTDTVLLIRARRGRAIRRSPSPHATPRGTRTPSHSWPSTPPTPCSTPPP